MTSTCELVAERRIAVMGTEAHVLVVGPDPTLLDGVVDQLEDLEDRWSRFRPTSEVSRLNRRAGEAVHVSDVTIRLVETAVAAWTLTEGRYDPTVLHALERSGYDRTFEAIDQAEPAPAPGERQAPAEPAPGPACIIVDAEHGTVRLPTGVGFDPGGIGKGLAADLAVDRALDRGATGVLVNIGGDLRVHGRPPRGRSWPVTVHEPAVTDAPVGRLELSQGAIATTTTQRRTWPGAGGTRHHHVIDPSTGEAWAGAARQVTVVAADGWWAEAAAKALVAPGASLPPYCAAIVIDHDGLCHRLGPLEGYER